MFEDNSLTYPIQPTGSYCEFWEFSFEKNFWTDLSSSYSSKKIKEFGWKKLNSKTSEIGLVFASENNLNYSHTKWTQIITPKEQENSQLFMIPINTNFIFTRTYHFLTLEGENLQTARLGIDYACNKQLFNHVPGASAFCRKDYLQKYLKNYQQRYEDLNLSYCYSPITPLSFVLEYPKDCNLFLLEVENLLKKFNESSMPIEWITKSALKHKGYGIELLDHSLAEYFYTIYNSEYASCSNILPTHKKLIVQKYITNPALIENRKFDLRIFVICINADPLVVGWAPNNGHVRLSDLEFDANSKNFTTHITANIVNENPGALEYLKKYRFNLRELAQYLEKKIGNVENWLQNVAFLQIKKLLIHMFRATQQNFLVKRSGLFEFFGVDFILDDSYKKFYLLESNRRPDLKEKNEDLQYREDMIIEDVVALADYFLENQAELVNTDRIFEKFMAFEPLIDETKSDPYFGVISKECAVEMKDWNFDLPIDPMIEPLQFYIENY